jgi:hypothetical protein
LTAIPGVRVVLLPDGHGGDAGAGAFIPVTNGHRPGAFASIVNASGQRRTEHRRIARPDS